MSILMLELRIFKLHMLQAFRVYREHVSIRLNINIMCVLYVVLVCIFWNVLLSLLAPLSLRVGPASVVKEEGSFVVLDCVVDGFPTPTITWTKDLANVPPCPRSEVCVSEGNFIYIPSARPQDSGLYTCHVQRFMERLTYSADVTVLARNSK